MKSILLLAPLLCLACAREDTAALHRRPISPAATSGWARLPLDAEAQRNLKGAWISDAEGRSVPFLEAREGLWESRALTLENLMLGRDAQGRPTAEFTLHLPEGWQIGEREALRLDLDLEGPAPWVVALQAERQREGGAFIAYDVPTGDHLYNLSPSGSRTTCTLPWDGQRYRLTLAPTQGEAPRIRGLKVRAETRPEALEAETALDATLEAVPGQSGTWSIRLPDEERVVGLDLLLAPPAAPLRPEVRVGESPDAEDRGWPGTDLVWNLPALNTRSTRIALLPALTKRLTLRLPQGAQPQSVRVLVRRQTLIFPVEAGRSHALHLGGEARTAPGNLGSLPSLRTLVAAAPLSLGPREPDPQGLPRRIGADQRARPWMPWIAGLAVLGMALAAWKLLPGKARPDA